ncbi:hypothetical protein ACFL6S_14390 [Candidatus Poribacteria bacterium]
MRKQQGERLFSSLESTLALCTHILRQGNMTEERAELLQEILDKLKEIKEKLPDQKRSAGRSNGPEIVTNISVAIAKIAELVLEFFKT